MVLNLLFYLLLALNKNVGKTNKNLLNVINFKIIYIYYIYLLFIYKLKFKNLKI